MSRPSRFQCLRAPVRILCPFASWQTPALGPRWASQEADNNVRPPARLLKGSLLVPLSFQKGKDISTALDVRNPDFADTKITYFSLSSGIFVVPGLLSFGSTLGLSCVEEPQPTTRGPVSSSAAMKTSRTLQRNMATS